MKKIFLGLFLTVGVSGFALAGMENTLDKDSYLLEKSQFELKNFSCTIGIYTKISDKCGNYIGTRRETYEASGDACSGFEGGLSVVNKSETIDTGSCQTVGDKLVEIISNLF